MWFVLSVASGLSSSVDKVLNRIALRHRSNALAYSVVYLFIASALSLPFALPIRLHLSPRLLVLIVIESMVWAVASAFVFAAHVNTEVSFSSIITRTRILWVIPFSYLLLDEKISLMTIVGIFIIFFGLAVLFLKGNLHKSRGVHLVLVSSIFAALGSVINAFLVREFLTAAQATFFAMIGQALVLAVILFLRGSPFSKVKSVLKYSWYITLCATALEVLAYILLNQAYKTGLASSVTAVYMAMSVSAVWIGVVFLRERDYLGKKLISSLVVTVGIIVVKMFS